MKYFRKVWHQLLRKMHEKNLFFSTVSKALSSTESFLAFETPYLSRTSQLCRVHGLVPQGAQLVLNTRHAHQTHFRGFAYLKGLGRRGLLAWDWLWAGLLG